MATRRRTASASATRRTRRRRTAQDPLVQIAPETARSILGIVLIVLGALVLIALLLPRDGIVNRVVSDLLRPTFGQGAWLLPLLLIVAGVFVERAPRSGSGWRVSVVGGGVTLLGALGLIHLLVGEGNRPRQLREGGGWLGAQLSDALSGLLSPPGAFVVLLGLVVAGVLLLFNLTVRALVSPVASGGRALAGVLSAPVPGTAGATTGGSDGSGRGGSANSGGRGATVERERGQSDGAGGDDATQAADPALPKPLPSPAPMSQTVWAGSREASAATATGGPASSAPAALAPARTAGEEATGDATVIEDPTAPATGDGLTAGAVGVPAGTSDVAGPAGAMAASGGLLAAGGAPKPVGERGWQLPPLELLEPPVAARPGARLDHARNIRIIEEKLRSFQIPATVTGANSGPVVTQYEVRPDARIKLSRIEGLADDLAMALAARSIRIEAPIPGKDVVGIEIPNHASEVVSFRQLVEDAQMLEATSKLTFALGRDVSGKAYAVDLAKMPHLLISGATGSGKSVCVNALITSLLVRSKPDEVRLILVDLKRVELAAYDALPHLLTNVIVEAGDAKAALLWAVNQMEERYRALASKAERNITAYNASPRVSRDERLPYIVIVIDELADLIMREGRKVEDPVVKIAQKARAVGIHLVLATQRPSVNVVTGLIKANVPSRIAFAMASNIDSRTVLDQPGAEDLIGRGDMLYQPADLPRPVRLQGVFVSDHEVRAITDHWREQAPEPEYDSEILAWHDGEVGGGGQFGWLAQASEDELTPRAAELIVESGRASTSMLQTRLKVGFNRATRIMDELERYGVVGPQDPRNPAVPRQVFGPENWLRSPDEVNADL